MIQVVTALWANIDVVDIECGPEKRHHALNYLRQILARLKLAETPSLNTFASREKPEYAHGSEKVRKHDLTPQALQNAAQVAPERGGLTVDDSPPEEAPQP